jgi:glycerate kinase
LKFVIALDSFKGSISSKDACDAVKRGILSVLPDANAEAVPMADGGEGTMDSIVAACGGQIRTCTVRDPLGRAIAARYGIISSPARFGDTLKEISRSQSPAKASPSSTIKMQDKAPVAPENAAPFSVAIIEMAEASGLCLLGDHERDPLIASTFGTGQLILDALDDGCRDFIICIGGSATNDGGAGMAQALGFDLLDDAGQPIPPGGGGLALLDRISAENADARLSACRFTVASDVTNPLCGDNGASAIFGPQKGATPEMVQVLDANLQKFSSIIRRDLGKEISDVPGAGAAGGLGGGLMAFLDAKLVSGIGLVMDIVGLKDKIRHSDFVVTGEGRYDQQTASGKTPMGIAMAAKEIGVPVILIAGSIADAALTSNIKIADHPWFAYAGSLVSEKIDARYAINHAAELLEETAATIAEELAALTEKR